MPALRTTLLTVLVTLGVPATIYMGLLGAMITMPNLQAHAIYLHRVTLTWSKDLNTPEQFGFSHNQVSSFQIEAGDSVSLHAWHVLPLGVYRRNLDQLLRYDQTGAHHESPHFRLLRDDPTARLVLCFHGASGTLASGWRPDSYRTLYSGAPDKIHVLTFDFRGYGLSTGTPTEDGIIQDAVAVYRWATEVAKIPPERIVLFGQSLGSAVAVALADHLAVQVPSVSCAGLIITASFSDIATLTATYRIGGFVPVLSPIAKIRPLFRYFVRYLQSTWLNTDRIGRAIRNAERYHVTLIHAEDDTDISYSHSEVLFWHAVNASTSSGISRHALESEKEKGRVWLGEGGWSFDWPTEKGLIRLEVLKYGVHDKIMSYPVVALAVLRTFQASDARFAT